MLLEVNWLKNLNYKYIKFGFPFRFVSGERLGPHECVRDISIKAGEEADISVAMVSPEKPGMYQGQWRMYCPQGAPFGGKLLLL